MSIGIENKDSSFFTIESLDVELNTHDFERNLISLSITERTAGLTQGNLIFYDPEHWFSKILRTGVGLKISWGYKNRGVSPDSLIEKKLNLDEITGSLIRRGLQGFVSSPTGSGDNAGKVIYNCKFTAYGFRGPDQAKYYITGTKRTVIQEAFAELGITIIEIGFAREKEAVTKDTAIRQDEPTFSFLNRLAKEWRCLFHVGFNPTGQGVGIFVDANKIGEPQYSKLLLGASGTSNIIGYMGELNNVKSYKWSSSESESGIGSNVMMDIVDGQIIFRRFVAEEEQTITYRLNIKEIQKVYEKAGDIQSQFKLMNELRNTKTFEQIEHFFTKVTQSTAPEGYGYKLSCEMIGNPLFAPPNQIVINNGFPARLGGKQSKWYIQNATHNIDKSGYNMTINIVDVFTQSPIGAPIR